MANFNATHFVSLAWRKALANYIESNLKWGRLSATKSLSVYWSPSDGQAESIYPNMHIKPSQAPVDDHSTTPTIDQSTVTEFGDGVIALCKDGDHDETTVIRIKANNVEEASKIMLYLWPLLNPKANKTGLDLDLGDLYYGQIGKITVMNHGYAGVEQNPNGSGIHIYDIIIRAIFPIVKVVNAKTMASLTVEIDMGGE